MKNKLIILFGVASWIYTAIFAIFTVLSGNIPFWYDPARDMLSAWENLHKLTLIGPTSGIPGFFYGPYWIWWLSGAELISKNPAFVTLLTMVLPYLLIFFGVLMLFRELFGKFTTILLWLLFFVSFQGYMTQVWNPYLAPILFLSITSILVLHTKRITDTISVLPLFFAGVITGLALNIHISFSVGFSVGCLLYIVIQNIFFLPRKTKGDMFKQTFFSLGSFISGILLIFLPFFFFEIRHGFMQTKVALNAFLHGGAVVTQHGLSRIEIIQQFFLVYSQLLHLPFFLSLIVLIMLGVLYIFFVGKKEWKFSQDERNLFLFLFIISFCVLGLYLSARNPIWNYHFVGTEVLWLLLIGLLIKRIPFAKYLLFAWCIYLCFVFGANFISSMRTNPLTRGSLYTKEYIVATVKNDAGNKPYTVYAYSPSIYTYEYNYLFRWMTGHEFSYDPGQIQRVGTVYLILPPAKQSLLEDFVHFRTPDRLYITTKTWHIPDGTIILRRQEQ